MLSVCCSALFFSPRNVSAEVFLLAGDNDTVVGEIKYVTATKEDTLLDLARKNGLGHDEIVKANPSVNRWLPGEGTRVLLPTEFILPDAPREGVVVNLAELRLYYFPNLKKGEQSKVYTFPISVGRMDWKTPLGKTKIIKKETDPQWRPTESIKAEHSMEGDLLPDVIPGGSPANPLGKFALRLEKTGYLIHGTDESKEFGIGMRVTHGCIRMYPEDIAELYELVAVGTPVTLIDQPIKAGWRNGELLIEADAPLQDDDEAVVDFSHQLGIEEAMNRITAVAGPTAVDQQKIGTIVELGNGVPAKIAQRDLPPAASVLEPAVQSQKEAPAQLSSY